MLRWNWNIFSVPPPKSKVKHNLPTNKRTRYHTIKSEWPILQQTDILGQSEDVILQTNMAALGCWELEMNKNLIHLLEYFVVSRILNTKKKNLNVYFSLFVHLIYAPYSRMCVIILWDVMSRADVWLSSAIHWDLTFKLNLYGWLIDVLIYSL